jgi:choline dehydrogenase-like flavoprotein
MKHCDNRQSWVMRGEVLGGTSRINSMAYTRGGPAEYDAWSAMGHSEVNQNPMHCRMPHKSWSFYESVHKID